MFTKHKTILTMIAALATATIFCTTLSGASENAALTATLNEVSGTVQTISATDGALQNARPGQVMVENEQVITHEDGRARLDLSNKTLIRIGPLTAFTLLSLEERDGSAYTLIDLNVGDLWIILNGGSLDVETPAGLASVRGSFMHVHVASGSGAVFVSCLEGLCQVGSAAGTLGLTTGQVANLASASNLPEAGLISEEEISLWLLTNPEAAQAVAALSQVAPPVLETPVPQGTPTGTPCPYPEGWLPVTVQSGQNIVTLALAGGITPQQLAASNCMDLFSPLKPGSIIYVPPITPTATSTKLLSIATLTPTSTPYDCGPPSDWTIHAVVAGETLEMLAGAYGESIANLQKANCLGDSTAIVPGVVLFVPNVPTRTPTALLTPVRSATPTLSGTSGSGSTDSNTEFANPRGPNNVEITECINLYRIYVKDPDGIDKVYAEFSVGDDTFDYPVVVELEFITIETLGARYRKEISIDTTSKTPPTKVYWRFMVKDKKGNTAYYPADTPYSFTDELKCTGSGTSSPSDYYTSITGPQSTISQCDNEFKVTINEPDGVYWAKVEYSVKDNIFDFSSSTDGDKLLTLISGSNTTGTWRTILIITAEADDIVYWRFAVKDKTGKVTYSNVYSYTSNLCP